MALKEFTVSAVLSVLFVVAFISFGTNIAIQEEAEINIANDTRVNALHTSANRTLFNYNEEGKTLQEQSNDTLGTFVDEDEGGDFIQKSITSATLGIVGLFTGFVGVIYDIIFDPLLKIILPTAPEVRRVLGIALMTIISIITVFAGWRFARIGD